MSIPLSRATIPRKRAKGGEDAKAIYAIRERRNLLGLRPTIWLVSSSVADIIIISTLAIRGIAMAPLSISILAYEFAAAVVFG
jgi:H+-transporting ATPase